jgi:hypothetical protein
MDTWNTSFSGYADAKLPLIVAESSLVTSDSCLVFLSSTLKRTHLREIYDCSGINKEIYSAVFFLFIYIRDIYNLL